MSIKISETLLTCYYDKNTLQNILNNANRINSVVDIGDFKYADEVVDVLVQPTANKEELLKENMGFEQVAVQMYEELYDHVSSQECKKKQICS